MPKILVINGPNLNLLGKREPEMYGDVTLDNLKAQLTEQAKAAGMQSNHEGEIVDFIHREGDAADGLIINPAALTHYSFTIRDAIAATDVKAIEVHITNIFAREEFRQRSVISPVCLGQISGLGAESYRLALAYFIGRPR